MNDDLLIAIVMVFLVVCYLLGPGINAVLIALAHRILGCDKDRNRMKERTRDIVERCGKDESDE